mgnify:CR=1 FL=1
MAVHEIVIASAVPKPMPAFTTVPPPPLKVAGVRFRSFGNTGGNEIYLGVGDLGVGSNRVEKGHFWSKPGSYPVTFTYDPSALTLVATGPFGTLTYNLPVDWFSRSGVLGFITTLAYRGDHSQFEVPNPFLDQDSYTLWDLSVVWSDTSGHWQVGLHGKNLTDEKTMVWRNDVALTNSNSYFGVPERGRSIAVQARYRF